MSSILKVDNLQTGAGATHSISSLGITSPGTLLQEICGICDGRTVSGVTFPNVTAYQSLTTSYADLTGSEITYTPPTGTTTVVFKFSWHWSSDNYSGISHYKAFLDGTEMTIYRTTVASQYATQDYAKFRQNFIFPILIDSSLASDDVANSKLKTWSGAKTFKMQAREYSSSYQAYAHENRWWDGTSATGSNTFVCPTMTIKAIA